MSRTLLSVNVSLAREATIGGRKVMTAIGKLPTPDPVAVKPLGLEGDEQADLSVHGGLSKAVYAYPSEHYPSADRGAQAQVSLWRSLPPGLAKTSRSPACWKQVWIGDVLRFQHCEMAVTSRASVLQFNAAMGFNQASKLMASNAWCGFYWTCGWPARCSGPIVRADPGPREVASRSFRSRLAAPPALTRSSPRKPSRSVRGTMRPPLIAPPMLAYRHASMRQHAEVLKHVMLTRVLRT